MGIITIYTLNRPQTTIRKELRNFAVEDTSIIDKIFLTDKNNRKILLERQPNGEWLVNKKFYARPDAINILLETIKNVEVKYPVSRSAHNNVVKQLAAKSVKVEIYSGNKLLKTYYVGGPTQDHVGTYMLLENSTVPMVVYVPGFNGYLTPRFDTYEKTWRAPRIFHYSYPEIYAVSVIYPNKPQNSFKAINNNNVYQLISLRDSTPIKDFDTLAIKLFIGKFKNVNYDVALTQINPHKRDSIIHSTPKAIFIVEDIHHKKRILKTFLKETNFTGAKSQIPNQPKYDIDNMYGWLPQDSLFVIVQYYIFDKLLRTPEDFKKK